MAFNEKELEIVNFGIQNGKSKDEVQRALISYRTGVPQPKKTPEGYTGTDAIQDVIETGSGIARQLGLAGEKIVKEATDPTRSVADKAVAIGAEAFRGGARAFGEGVIGLGKVALPQQTEEELGAVAQETGQMIGEQPAIQELLTRYNSLDPETKKGVDNVLGYAEGLGEILTGGVASRIAKTTINTATDITKKSIRLADEGVQKGRSLFVRPAKDIEDVITQADTTLGAVRKTAEGAAPERTLREQWVGIQPDIKKRIAGKQAQLQEYFDVAHARNADDTLPTPYEHGAQQAQSAVESMESLLNESGGKIGATREKIGTYMAPIESVARIETSFMNQLGKLNLEIKNGVVRQKTGTVSKASTGDVNILNGFYQDIKAIKQSPKLTNLIELRSAFDSKINFGKRAAEVSNEVDPLSRQVRKDIADEAAKIVGKTEAAELKRFSEFMDAYSDLKSYTDRRAGGEYLLRLVLSGRGGEARQIIRTIKEYTGKDLMDDATMMTIATDLIGNNRQKNLFRQEVTKSGLDAARALAGDARGAASLLSNFITKNFLDEEKIYLDAAL